jgi:UDP-N-acetylglucosamine 2-epimerase
MSDVFFRELDIPPPDQHLDIGSGSHGQQTGRMLERLEQVLIERRPDAVLIYGDTNSTLAGALTASKLNIPVAHVEAGLRSFVRSMPEEINRIVADHVSRWLFAPSESAQRQLAEEGIREGVFVVGDVMADCVRRFRQIASQRSTILDCLNVKPGQYAVATVHRAANTDSRQCLADLLAGLNRLSCPVVLPLHPRTSAAIRRMGLEEVLHSGKSRSQAGSPSEGILPIEPVGYLDMLQLQQHAQVVLTDSGGVQKEAYYLGVPCVTLRDETEWTETVAAGWNRLVGTNPQALCEAVDSFRTRRPSERPVLYGDGRAAERIVTILDASF